MKPKRYLITGAAGSGKSTIGNHLVSLGYTALETDNNNLSYWIDKKTKQRVRYQRAAGEVALSKMTRIWDRTAMLKLLRGSTDDPLFICGYADNQIEFFDYFDTIFLLTIDADVTSYRLDSRTTGEWGKVPMELNHVLHSIAPIRDAALKSGALPIDAMLPVDNVVGKILEYTRNGS